MSRFTYLFFCLAVLFPGTSRASEDSANELTGIFHKEVSKNPAYLEIDGSGFISRIIVTGDLLKDLADGTRVWIKGRIETRLYGSPDTPQQGDQQAPSQWFIVFHVEKCRKIAKPFERPQDDELQNKQVEATR